MTDWEMMQEVQRLLAVKASKFQISRSTLQRLYQLAQGELLRAS